MAKSKKFSSQLKYCTLAATDSKVGVYTRANEIVEKSALQCQNQEENNLIKDKNVGVLKLCISIFDRCLRLLVLIYFDYDYSHGACT